MSRYDCRVACDATAAPLRANHLSSPLRLLHTEQTCCGTTSLRASPPPNAPSVCHGIEGDEGLERQLFALLTPSSVTSPCCAVVWVLLPQGLHQQTLQGKFMLQVDEVVNIAAGLKDRSVRPTNTTTHSLILAHSACCCAAERCPTHLSATAALTMHGVGVCYALHGLAAACRASKGGP